jgi:hypothetical protein
VTSKLHVLRLPAESVAEQKTVVVPSGKTVPEAGVQFTVRSRPQPSLAVA